MHSYILKILPCQANCELNAVYTHQMQAQSTVPRTAVSCEGKPSIPLLEAYFLLDGTLE